MSSLEMPAWVLGMWLVVRPLGNYLARRADARSGLTTMEEDQLTAAFETLGAARVQEGLSAHGHGWNDCFLAFATGGRPFGLRPALRKGWRSHPVASLSVDATKTVVRTWDRKEAAFRRLASEWLEEQESITAASEALHAAGQKVAEVGDHQSELCTR
jgi:hypothetical protein